MIEYNLEKHKPKIFYDVNGIRKYLCIVRKMLIHITPEETVRQSFLNYLISEVKVPITKILVEEPILYHQKEGSIKHKGRADILVLDENDKPLVIYECKKENDSFITQVYKQADNYYDAIRTVVYVGIVIGSNLHFYYYEYENLDNEDVKERIDLAEHPSYLGLLNDEDFEIFEYEEDIFERPNFIKPISQSEIEFYVDYGIIGNGTNENLYPFLINFYGWINDPNDKFEIKGKIQDIGIKFTKFGNAGGGQFTQEYRAFLLEDKFEKPIVFFALNGMSSGENSPIGTSLFVAIETNEHSHSSLQLRCDKYIKIENNIAEIWHDGTITVGKLGASKRHELLSFISTKQNNILSENKIVLGKIDFSKEIKSQQKETKKFINNLIEYAILRDEFRQHKKGIS